MSIIKRLINRVYRLYGYINPIQYARSIGVSIGENCRLVGQPRWGSEPFLITLGNYVEISFNVTFITHDGSTWVFREQERYKNVLRFGRIVVGNNCFIGANSTIMPGVTIGNECIIGAGSLVTKSVPSGEIWGGVPAKRICSTIEFAEKCLAESPDYDADKLNSNREEELKKIAKVGHTHE